MKTLNELRDKIHENAKNKGFWDNQRETGALLMLCVSELAEALEADRMGKHSDTTGINELIKAGYTWDDTPVSYQSYFVRDVKNTFEDELADTIIRVLDLCGANGIDIDKHIELKMKYNATRERLHGKKY